jgi:hypothetical protein
VRNLYQNLHHNQFVLIVEMKLMNTLKVIKVINKIMKKAQEMTNEVTAEMVVWFFIGAFIIGFGTILASLWW